MTRSDAARGNAIRPSIKRAQHRSFTHLYQLAMFSPALGRVVRSTTSLPSSSVCTFGRPAVGLNAAQQTYTRPTHQRRPSSSKASIPPDGSNANGSNSAQQATGTSTAKAPTRRVTGRASKKRTAAAPALNVPHVPPTDYLQKPGKLILTSGEYPMTFANCSP